jgi:hypothetical protein
MDQDERACFNQFVVEVSWFDHYDEVSSLIFPENESHVIHFYHLPLQKE